MRIHYRVTGEQIEIIRCFGTDPQIVLPERIEGLPVVRTAAYAFSDRKGAEEEDVRVFETEEHRMFGGSESLLAGGAVESVFFPDTMEKIGRYAFYGCRNLACRPRKRGVHRMPFSQQAEGEAYRRRADLCEGDSGRALAED